MVLRLAIISFCCTSLFAQEVPPKDSVRVLNEVIVNAYSYNHSLKESPVALGIIGAREIARFNPVSILSAVNTIPGVRMEERSPGSYRFSIRGSTLRSPFGVRNVKFYWNGLPLTDGGGNTYLNLLDVDAIARAEIIKGPGASLYGAGTGGVVLLTSPINKQNQVQLATSGGSFGLQRYQTSAFLGNSKARVFVNYAHQQAEGYRQQTAMRRDVLNTQGEFSLGSKSTLQTTVFYTDIYYQTPGGLTLSQYNTDPRQARPPSKTTAGAVQQQAAVRNKTIYGGASYDYQWNDKWSTKAGLYYSYTDFTNPSILNYERRNEYNWGGRTTTQYEFEGNEVKGKLTFGLEFQNFFSPLTDYGNKLGVQDTLQTDDRLYSRFLIGFTQLELELPEKFFLTVGSSANFLNYKFNRVGGIPPIGEQTRNFEPVVSPRIAVLKKFSESLSLFASASKGFSPPSLAEVRPSSGVYNNSLAPEQGISYELGVRGSIFKNISFDIVAYDFELSQTIVSQNGGQYFINAGNTSQKGLETSLSWQQNFSSSIFSNLKIWTSGNFTKYRFVNYAHDGVSYSGNQITGTPANTVAIGADILLAKTFYCNLTTYSAGRIPLNDANTDFASAYFLAGARIGYKNQIRNKTPLEFFAGVDNAFDQRYSLGNDINAVGSRYYNVATARNFYFGLKITPKLN